MPSPLRIGYYGLPLGALLLARDGHQIEWTVLSPQPQPGRRRLSRFLPDARRLDLVDEGVSASWQKAVSGMLAQKPVDLIVSWFFTRRILGEWLKLAPLGAIGVHPSLLPKYRGPDPFFAVIDACEDVTGVTVHRLTDAYDEGAILLQRRIDVGLRNSWQLARALDRPSLAALREVTKAYAEGRPPREQDQDERQVSYAPQPEGDQLRVDWNWPTDRVMRRLRALCPVPGLALELVGQPFLVTEAVPSDEYPRALLPGEAYLGRLLTLRTADGAITVKKAALLLGEDEEPVAYSGDELANHLSAMREKLNGIRVLIC